MRFDVGPMRKLGVMLALIAASFALVASTAEAAKTSEKEGRKFSRKYMKKERRQFDFGPDWVQRECYRIGRDGVGNQGVAPRGVVCMFSNLENGGDRCYLNAIAVKDTKRFLTAQSVAPSALPYHRLGDPADCQPDAPLIEWPTRYWPGIVGNPL